MRTAFISSGISETEVSRVFDSIVVHKGHAINYNEFIAATMFDDAPIPPRPTLPSLTFFSLFLFL